MIPEQVAGSNRKRWPDRPKCAQPNNQTQYNDEIDLRDLIIALWEGKWIIIASVVFAMAAALAYLNLVPQTFKGQINLKPLTAVQMLPYQAVVKSEMMLVDEEVLKAALSQSLQNIAPLNNAGGAVSSVKLSTTSIDFVTKQPQQASDTWKAAMPVYVGIAKDILSNQYEAAVHSLTVEHALSMDELKKQIYLAKIADIETNKSAQITAETLPYIRGYKVLQAEVDWLQQQMNNNGQLSEIENPFEQADIVIVNYDLGSINLQPKIKPTLLLALSFILGGMLGVFILIIRNTLRK